MSPLVESGAFGLAGETRIILGIDPGLAHTGWGVVEQCGHRLGCVAYGCVATPASQPLAERLMKIHHQIGAVVERFRPECAGIETVWFDQNVTAAFAAGEVRGAAQACTPCGKMSESFINLLRTMQTERRGSIGEDV